jgi:tripartite-type tricarboxylate transporter receptor subunit TctC
LIDQALARAGALAWRLQQTGITTETNPMFPRSIKRRVLFTAVLATAACSALAQAPAKWPAKPVTLVVPYSAGGGTDIVARALAQRLAELWGQQVVVDNRTGANGVVGSASVAKAAPDGHTLMMVVGSHAINPVLMKQLPYDTPKAFTPITRVADSPTVFVVAAGAPWKNLGDLVEAARKTEIPAGYSEGQTRLTGELANQAAGIKLSGVPYKGGAPIMVDVMGGHLPVGITSVLSALPHVRAGKLRVVGVADKQRTSVFPDAQTFHEAGVNGVESLSWYGLFGPAGLPPAIVAQINRDLKAVTAEPQLSKQLAEQGARVVLTPPDEFARFLAAETTKWGQVAQRAGIQPE